MVKKQITKICDVCGTQFVTNRPHQVSCSYECAKIRCRRRQAENRRKNKIENQNRKERQTHTKQLVDDAVEARKLGMSYGKYKEMQYREEMR